MKNIFITLILLVSILSSCKSNHNYTLSEVKEYSLKLNLPSEKLFFINADSIKKYYSGKKISLQNHGIKVMDSELNVLKTKDGKCSIKKLKEVSTLESLDIDADESNDFVKIYPNLSTKLEKTKYTILCIWSKYYPKKVTLENIGLAKETKEKYKNCQILYLNADIYSELYSKIHEK